MYKITIYVLVLFVIVIIAKPPLKDGQFTIDLNEYSHCNSFNECRTIINYDCDLIAVNIKYSKQLSAEYRSYKAKRCIEFRLWPNSICVDNRCIVYRNSDPYQFEKNLEDSQAKDTLNMSRFSESRIEDKTFILRFLFFNIMKVIGGGL